MQFLKIKTYRNNFIVYISSLLAACVVLGIFLCRVVVSDQIRKNENAAMNSFNRVEANLALAEDKIDNYVLFLYSSKPLLRDFVCFFGNDAETYLTLRLDSSDGAAQVSSMPDDLERFVSGNQYMVKEIAFQSPARMNLMYFQENQGTSFRFNVPNGTPLLSENDIAFGYVYSKKVLDPQSINKPMGELRFVVDPQKEIAGSVDAGIGHAAVMSGKSSLYFPAKPGGGRERDFQQIYAGSGARGELHEGPFRTVYYSVYASKSHGYKFVSTVDTGEIFENNRSLFLLIVVGMFLIFAIISAVIAVFMARDARYLGRMLVTIGDAKRGKFRKIDLGRRNDELRLIAQELNGMYVQLNHYIETEYKLKLRQKDTEMKMLQRQVNPHFLYNTLEIIRSCASVNHDEQVADAIADLGAMFREVVRTEDVVTVEKELEILTRYLKIMEFKFAGSFSYLIDVPDEIRALRTVKLWLQPLCENFFVHGYDKSSEFNLLLVTGEVEPGAYVIEVADNGEAVAPEKLEELNRTFRRKEDAESSGGGLVNVYARLRYFYGERLGMTIANRPEGGVTITVRIGRDELCTG